MKKTTSQKSLAPNSFELIYSLKPRDVQLQKTAERVFFCGISNENLQKLH